MPFPHTRSRALVALSLLVTLVMIFSVPVVAQDDSDDSSEETLEELKEERERVQAEATAQAVEVDAAEADFEVLAKALDDINAAVDLQEARLLDAEQAVASAEAQVLAAEERREAIAVEIAALDGVVADLAVAAFTGEGGANGEDLTAFLLNDDPTEAARRRSLVQFQTGNLSDALDRMRALEAEAEVVEEERARAVEAAQQQKVEVVTRRGELREAEDAQIELVIASEARLEARLAEAAIIADLDADLAAEIRREEEAIARRIREEAARKAAAEAAKRRPAPPPPADRGDMVDAEGFIVHNSIAGNVSRMIRDAAANGVVLTGYGYRSSQRTAELRIINGCPDVYDSPPSSCRIPTARPGQSMHEFGQAIDFRSCWRGSDCFTWLSRNAANYGFYNLPGESWHWSTNAR